jgi:hypothetical protein
MGGLLGFLWIPHASALAFGDLSMDLGHLIPKFL